MILFIYFQCYYSENDSKPKTRSTQRTWLNSMKDRVVNKISKGFEYLETKLHSSSTSYRKNKQRQKLNKALAFTSSSRGRLKHPSRGRHRRFVAMPMVLTAFSAAGATPIRYQYSHFDTDSMPVGIDNRCTACISCDIADFDGELTPCNRTIRGFGGTTTTNVQKGTILWRWQDDEGLTHEHRIPNSYYVPAGKVRLLSPQHWSKELQKQKIGKTSPYSRTDDRQCTLTWGNEKFRLTVPMDKLTNVATYHLAPGYKKFSAFCSMAKVNVKKDLIITEPATVNVVEDEQHSIGDPPTAKATDERIEDDDNAWQQPHDLDFHFNFDKTPQAQTQGRHNGIPIVEDDEQDKVPEIVTDEEDRQQTTDAAELLRIHQRFGHISFAKLQLMAKVGILPKKLEKCHPPVCTACMFAKATRKPWRNKQSHSYQKKVATTPGEVVSVDMMVSPTPGFIAQMTGKLTTQRYKYATIYVDQASHLSYVFLQKTATAEETLKGKQAWELYAREHGVIVKAYHADNGIFRANAWQDACRNSNQTLTFAGVNSHWSNGHAEKRIRDIQDLARTQLVHANSRWPNAVNANLWPYAVRMANEVINNSPSMQNPMRRTPLQVFSNSSVNPNIKHFHPMGCPVFVLDNALQQNKPFNKWKRRSRVGIYLGQSPQHGRNIALVLDRTTGLVSPQHHVAYDRHFQTVQRDHLDTQWQVKAGFLSQRESEKAKLPTTLLTVPTPTNKRMVTLENDNLSPKDKGKRRKTGTGIPEASSQGTQALQHPITTELTVENPLPPAMEAETAVPPATSDTTDQASTPQGDMAASDVSPSPPNLIEVMLTEIDCLTRNDVQGELFCLEALYPSAPPLDEIYAYKAAADPDTMYHHQAMKEPDADKFKDAMQKEVDDQMSNGNFTIVERRKVPRGATILPAVWQMKRKRDIRTREIKKYKARLNIDGSRMKKGVHYEQSYAPVASWNSIRLLLSMTTVHNWHTKQLDYVLAFPQAPIETDLYMEIPRGLDLEGVKNPKDYVLKLHKNVYGTKNAGRTWNKYLVNKLVNELGFVQSKVDECVLYRGRTMYVLYTDDSILAGPDENEINQIIEDMKRVKLDITVEGDLQDFLGVNIDRKEDGSIHLTQPHLIDQILKDLRLDADNVAVKSTPASSSKILSRHDDSEPFDNSFNYRSIIGKLNYLERGSRSDIAYIVHQCARFAVNPKKEHGDAIRWLGRYLKATRDKGTIIKPVKGEELVVYVDADFAGNYHKDDTNDRDSARSRHGYIILYEGCPVTWKSQLQTEITLSSTESEYTGLSYALREAIPIMELLNEMKSNGFPTTSAKPRIFCKVFEDNSGALEIANTHKYRPRTKHLNVKLHHFRDYVTRGEIKVVPIRTDSQLADYLTKPVNADILSKLRKLVMGW